MRRYIDKCVYTMINEYKNNPKRIRSDYNREREAIEVYKKFNKKIELEIEVLGE